MLNLMNSAKLNETLPCPLSKSEVLDEFVGVATDAVVDGVAKVFVDVVVVVAAIDDVPDDVVDILSKEDY